MKTTGLFFPAILWIAFSLFIQRTQAQTTSLVWAKNLPYSIAWSSAFPADLVVDNAGNYYITGAFEGKLDMSPGSGTYTIASLGIDDAFLAKYDASGNLVWARSFGTTGEDYVTGLHIENNTLYLAGAFQTPSMDIDPGTGTYTLQGNSSGGLAGFAALFDTNGNLQSAFSIPGTELFNVKPDNSGNLYLAGAFKGLMLDLDPGPGTYVASSTVNASIPTKDLFYGKYSPSGSMMWVNTKGGYSDDIAYSISVDPVTGNLAVAGGYNSAYIALANSSGSVIKEANFSADVLADVAFDQAGNFYFSGIYSSATDFDWSSTASYSLATNGSSRLGFVAKYTSSLAFSWAQTIVPFMTINHPQAQGPAISLAAKGDVLVIGGESNSGSASWLYFAKMDQTTGTTLWRNNLTSACYNGNSGNWGTAIAQHPDGSVIVTGVIGGSSSGSSSMPCTFDADPGSGTYVLTAGVANSSNRDIFMGKYGSCASAPSSTSAVSGATQVCPGALLNYSIDPVSEATGYNWLLPNGWTGSSQSNTIAVTSSTSSGVILLTATNSCGTFTQALLVASSPQLAMPSAIDGPSVTCAGSPALQYSVAAVSNATAYSWVLPSGWNGTSTTNVITVTAGSASGVLSVSAVDACSAGPAQTASITVNALPPVSISGHSVICSTYSVLLSVSGANTYTWNTSSNASSFSVSAGSSAMYSVAGTDANGCVNTSVLNMTVLPLPTVTIAGPSTLCIGSSASFTASGASTYTWNNAYEVANSLTISPPASTVLVAVGTDSNNCSNHGLLPITVYSVPVITVNSGSICAGQAFTFVPSGANTYVYPGGTNTVSPSGSNSYSIYGYDANGCVNSVAAMSNVTVTPLPLLSISAPPGICIGYNATLTASGATTFTWNTSLTGNSLAVAPPGTTTYSVRGTDGNGCTGTAVQTLIVYPIPTITATGPSTLCEGSAITLSASGAFTYTWTTVSNNISVLAKSITVSPATNSIYVAFGEDVHGCINNAYHSVTVYSVPVVSVNSGSICTGQSFTLIPSGANNYSFSGGSAVVSPASTTSYSITGSNSAGCASSAAAIANVFVNPLPLVSISGSSHACTGDTIPLTALGASTYTWDNSAVSNTLGAIPFGSSTSYTVSGTDVNGCQNTATTSIVVHSLPTVSISGTNTVCYGKAAVLTAAGANTYTWNTSAIGSTLSVSPGSNTSYTVTGTDVNGCKSSAVAGLSVNPLPSVTITGPLQICNGNSSTLTANGALTYTWSNATQGTLIAVNPSNNTSYTLSGSDANGCIGSTAITVTVNALPNLTVSGAAQVCSGGTVNLLAGGAATYTWSNGTFGAGIIVTPTSTTTYTVFAKDANGCYNSTITSIATLPLPALSISGPTVLCSGAGTVLTVSGASSYTWNNSSNSSSISVSPSGYTSYSVTGTGFNNCQNSATTAITVDHPVISISGPFQMCFGSIVTLTANGASTYTWSDASTATTLSVSPAISNSYAVTGTNMNGCVASASTILTVHPLPTITIGGAAQVCEGKSAPLNASGAFTYTWSNSSNGANISVSPTVTSSYTVSGTNSNGCSNSAITTVTVNPLPLIFATASPTFVCAGESTTLSASGANTYTWSNSRFTASYTLAPLITGTFTVKGSDAAGCTNSAAVTVSVSQCTGMNELAENRVLLKVYPNPATDVLHIQATSSITQLSIYDLTGKLLYQSSDPVADQLSINLAAFAKGLYILSVQSGSVTEKLKIVKY